MAKKRLQVILSEEATNALESTTLEARTGFKEGRITYSDVINEMVLTSKLDIRSLQQKHKTLQKTLEVLASEKELTIEKVREALADFRPRTAKRSQQDQLPLGDPSDE